MHEALLKDMETRMQAAVDLLTREFGGVRTGRKLKAVIKDPKLITPTGKFNVHNTQHDVY